MKGVPTIGHLIFALAFSVLLFSCEEDANNEAATEVATIGSGNSAADIIRNPITANNTTVDTSLLAQIRFKEKAFDFGEVDAGAVVKHRFSFTNTGNVPLLISDVRSTCGCTVADWPKRPIAPGESGEIPVSFDTKRKSGKQSKPITIMSNTYPNKTVIYMEGRVYGEDE